MKERCKLFQVKNYLQCTLKHLKNISYSQGILITTTRQMRSLFTNLLIPELTVLLWLEIGMLLF